MGLGISVTLSKQAFAAIFQQTSFSVPAMWAKLHVGDPGKVGAANPAGNTVRKDASACFSTDPVDNMDGTVTITSDASIGQWLGVSTTETYTHVSFWNDETAATPDAFVVSGTITSVAVTAGDNYEIPAGDCTATSSVAA